MLWWSDDLKTNIDSIDEQHKSIFDKADEIFNLGPDIEKDEFREVINFLMGYANNHFLEEEELMRSFEYKGLLEHRDEHNYFVEEIYKIYLKSNEKVDQELLVDLKVLIIEWLANHINVYDKKFINAMNEKNDYKS